MDHVKLLNKHFYTSNIPVKYHLSYLQKNFLNKPLSYNYGSFNIYFLSPLPSIFQAQYFSLSPSNLPPSLFKLENQELQKPTVS